MPYVSQASLSILVVRTHDTQTQKIMTEAIQEDVKKGSYSPYVWVPNSIADLLPKSALYELEDRIDLVQQAEEMTGWGWKSSGKGPPYKLISEDDQWMFAAPSLASARAGLVAWVKELRENE